MVTIEVMFDHLISVYVMHCSGHQWQVVEI